jgi:hypothetical protein
MTPIDTDSAVAQALPEGIAITYNADYEDMVLCSPTEAGESVRFIVKPAPLSNFYPHANDTKNVAPRLDDVTRPLSWASGTDTSSPESLSTGSSFTTPSRSRSTPYNADGAEKLIIRIKRKSAEREDDTLEKRPKYERKGWAISQRKLVPRTIPLHSGRF